MKIFTDDHKHEFLTPFPGLAVSGSPETIVADYYRNQPPQKLRPIRCTPRTPSDNPSGYSNVAEFLSDHFEPLNQSSHYLKPPVKDEGTDVVTAAAGVESGVCWDVKGISEEMYSSSSESENDDDDSSGDGKQPAIGKRKRKTSRKLELLMESLVTKMTEKQEQMHKQLLGMIEKREKERMIQEEVWKQLEMERMRKDEEARATETSRSLAIISFIGRVLGHEIEVNEDPDCRESWSSDRHLSGEDHILSKNIKCDRNSRRWPEAEVLALITLRSSFQRRFDAGSSKCSVWDEISAGMDHMGYSRSAKKCKEKWENINKYFKKTVENGKRHLESKKRCTYFWELETLYKNGVLNPGTPPNYTSGENDAKVERY